MCLWIIDDYFTPLFAPISNRFATNRLNFSELWRRPRISGRLSFWLMVVLWACSRFAPLATFWPACWPNWDETRLDTRETSL